jgi:hypothetical protein
MPQYALMNFIRCGFHKLQLNHFVLLTLDGDVLVTGV